MSATLAAYWAQSATASVAKSYATGDYVTARVEAGAVVVSRPARPAAVVTVARLQDAYGFEGARPEALRRADAATSDEDRAYWLAVAEQSE